MLALKYYITLFIIFYLLNFINFTLYGGIFSGDYLYYSVIFSLGYYHSYLNTKFYVKKLFTSLYKWSVI